MTTLYRKPGTTRFTGDRPGYGRPVMDSLPPVLGFGERPNPKSVWKVTLSPEDWKDMGSPDQIVVTARAAEPGESQEIVAEGGWRVPRGSVKIYPTPKYEPGMTGSAD